MRIGVQLFTVRKQAQKDLYKTILQLDSIGIKKIEAARIEFNEQTASIFKKAKEELGTEIMSTQIKYHVLDKDFDNILKFHKLVECNTAIISVLPTENIVGSAKDLIEFCRKANNLASKYNDEGIDFCYHHHDFEFMIRKEGIQFNTLKEYLSDNVKFIIDTYWATKGGFAPDKIIESLKQRVKGVHLRDYGLTGFKRKVKDYALGGGIIDFDSIIKACDKSGVEYAAIEQKTKTPFEDLQKSVAYLRKIGYGDYLF